MRVVAVILFVLALVVVIVPQFFTCGAHGFSLETAAGMMVPMKCSWTAGAEIALGIMLAIVAIGLWFFRERGARTILSILGIVGGVLMLIMVTGVLFGIGVCMKPVMPCVVYMRPIIYMLASLIIVDSAVGLVLSLKTLRAG